MAEGMFKNVIDKLVYAHPLYGDMYSDARNWAFGMLDRPLNAAQGAAAEGLEGAKKGITGEVDYSYLDAMSPEFQAENPRTAAAMAVAGDFFLDPMNLVGGGMFTKGTKALKDLGLKAESKLGSVLSSPSNYIENWYGPSDVVPFTDKDLINRDRLIKTKDWTSAKIDSFLKSKPEIAKKLKLDKVREQIPTTRTAEEADQYYRKVKGFLEWGEKSIDPVIQMLFSPQARALYKEKGINTGSQMHVKRELSKMDEFDRAIQDVERRAEGVTDKATLAKLAEERKALAKLYSRAKEKAVAQVGFNSHLIVQAERKGDIDDTIKAFVDTSSLTGYVPFSPKWFKEAIENTQSTMTYKKEGRKTKVEPLKVSENTLDVAADLIKKKWKQFGLKDNAQLMVKVASSSAGNHVTDVVSKNPTYNASKKAFAYFKKNDEIPTIDTLYDKLKETTEASKGKNKATVVAKTDEGVWLQTSKIGNAVIEGGINIVTLVTPSGRTVSFMSDQHDFLEKAPILGRILKQRLPVSQISISQPIFGDVLTSGELMRIPDTAKFNKLAREGRIVRGKASTPGTSPASERQMTNEQLQAFANAQASPEAIKAQQLKMGGAGLLAQGAIDQYNQE